VGAILDAVVGAVDVPVTLKIRTGINPESKNAVSIARIAEQAGVQLLTIHGRTRADRFKGDAEYDTIAAVVDAISIPVLANGDIDSTHKARRVLAHTGAAGVMIGRAAQGKLWLPGLIARQLGGEQCSAPSIVQQLHLLQRHVSALHQFYDDYLGVRIARKHVGWCLDGLVLSLSSRPEPGQTQRGVALPDLAHRNVALKAWKKRFNQLELARDQLDSLEALHHLAPQLLAFNQQAQEETASLTELPASYLTSGDLAA
jgi:tRNA-dihydrouridine synthase B